MVLILGEFLQNKCEEPREDCELVLHCTLCTHPLIIIMSMDQHSFYAATYNNQFNHSLKIFTIN